MENEKPKILIVEDEVTLLKILADKFTLEGFQVYEAKNGEEGLARALKEHPHLILLDLLMPKMNGITILRKLRETNEWGEKVPVIIVTNLSMDDRIIREIVKTKPTHYLLKSDFKIKDVVRKVKERLGVQ